MEGISMERLFYFYTATAKNVQLTIRDWLLRINPIQILDLSHLYWVSYEIADA